MTNIELLSFGPVPSRRLGNSLGVNNIPFKHCTYSCTYCQLGMNSKPTVQENTFYTSDEIIASVRKRLTSVKKRKIDYITVVPDGEATLDINLRETVKKLKKFDIPLAIITNASLLWKEEVQQTLQLFDLVSIKVDAVSETVFQQINRPGTSLQIATILKGIQEFAAIFTGKLISETMLINKIDYTTEIKKIATFLKTINNLQIAYLGVPTRPPTIKSIAPPDKITIDMCYDIFTAELGINRTGLLLGYEGNEFTFTDDIETDLLSIMSVHPMRQEAVDKVLKEHKLNWDFIEQLLLNNKLRKIEYQNEIYYLTIRPNIN